MRRSSRLRKRMWVPAAATACAVCLLGVWSTSGADNLAGIELQVDEVYMETGAPMVPGAVAGAPVVDARAVPVDGPRARPGFVSVLVHTDTAVTAAAARRADMWAFAAQRGGVVKYEYGTVLPGVFNLRDIPESAVEALERLPGVIKVEKDEYHPNALLLHDSMPLIRGLQSQISGAGLSADGSGVRICIVDTGIDSDHMMYSDRIDTSKGYDFYNDDSNPEDDHGHGSHCSGIAAGGTGISWDPCGTGSMPFQGVAPEATLIGCKVLNSAGGGYDSDIIAGIDYCADQTASGAQADVISMSIGTGNYSGPCTHGWAVAANNAVANGVVAVAASGNENYSNALSSPACGASVIAVGMTWKNDYPTCEDPTTNWNWGICTDYAPQTDDVGCFSNESDYLDVTAPGANIWSASIAAGGTSITGSSGTSMSCPTVAGLAALILGVDGTLTPAEVRQLIRDGAIDMGAAGFDRAYGYGRIDVIDTLNLLTPCTGDPDCDDGLYCNGAETCVAQSCQAGTDPCPGQSCDEGTDQCVVARGVVYEWNMDANPGWSTEGLWAWGQPTGGGGQYGGPDPTSGYTGGNVYGYNLAGDYENSLPERHLTTTAIDCTDLVEVSVKFRRWLGVEVSTYDHAYLRVSTNGTSWTNVWQNSAEVAETAWSLQEYDISSIADNQPTVYLRWTMGTTDGSWQYCGWNIDDVEIWARDTGVGCTVPGDCDDGLWCNGAEDCVAGSCVPGTAPDCNDGVGCTDDSCNEGTDSCDNLANDANCSDGLYCNGDEWCHATSDCQAGTAVNCNDGVGCTDDSCNEGTDSCDNIPDDGNCDNGLFCDGAETCHATLDCQAGSDPCPGQTCDEVNDVCCECEFDTDCDDGLYCNGAETCVSSCYCQAGGDPCPGEICNETTDTCETVECVVPGDCDDGSDCTTDTCVDNVCYNDCPATVSTFPYTEGFESGFGDWVNMAGDDMDWTRDSAGTPSSSTGPSSAHGGTYYVYTEASSPNYPDKTAILEGPCFDFSNTSGASLTFWYHMYGAAMGTLNVEVSEDCITWENVWSLSGNQGNTWYEANVDLSAYVGATVTIRFRGVTGSSYTSDMTVDDITVDVTPAQPCNTDPECDDGVFCNGAETCVGNLCQPGTDACPGQACDEDTDTCFAAECTVDGDCDDLNDCTVDTCVDYVCYNDCPSSVSTFPYSEGFESGWGDWVNASGDGMDWSRISGSTPSSSTGPSGAHGGTYYIYTEASSPNYPNVTAILDGPCFDLTGASDTEMTFWYHMYGTAMGTLYLEASEDCVSWATVWSLSGNQGNAWYEATVDLSAYDGTRPNLRFRGVTGSSYTSDMSVDDITITATVGPTCAVPADCDDGLWCNGAEDCIGGNCVDGTAIDCGDGVGCTDDSCNEGTDSCDNVANDANCDNGLWCDGGEWCDDVADCQPGTAVDCNDGVACTDDSCNEGTDLCDNVPNDAYCDDGVFCNGAETCHATLNCQTGTAVDCDDDIGCTDDSCNEGTDSCDNIANDAHCPDNGLFCDGTEYCDAVADCSSTGDPCSGGEICNEETDTCDPGDAAKIEAGSVTIGGTAVTVNLTNTYVSPVVVCSVQYNNNTTPVVTRVTSVTSTSFGVYLQNPSGGAVATETVNCIVVEEGTWTIDGVNIEAQTYLSTVTDENNSWVGEAQTYGQTYTNPVVIGQVMSDNDPLWSVFWCQGTARGNPPIATALKTGKTVCEDTDTTRANETIGFIVFEAGHSTIGGVAFEALVGADTVRGVTDTPPYTYTFNTSFGSAPTVAVTTMAGVDGGNGGWSYTHGPTMATTTTLYLSIDEDQVGDLERNHTTEQVGYIVFESSVVYP